MKEKKIVLLSFFLFLNGCNNYSNLNLNKKNFIEQEFKKINAKNNIYITVKLYQKNNSKSLIIAESINIFNEIYLNKFEQYLLKLMKNNKKLTELDNKLNNKKDKFSKIIFFYNLEEKTKIFLLKNLTLFKKNCKNRYCFYTYKINKKNLKKHFETILKNYYLTLYKEEKNNIEVFFDTKG